MSATATAPAANQVKVEDAGPARKRLTITIPAQTVDDKLGESMSTLSTQTVLPGFRKGKAPQKLLERRFGTNVRTETKGQLVAAAYAQAIEEHKIKPVGEPEPSDEMKALELEPGKPMTFSVEVEVVPSFELPDFGGLEITKPMLEIGNDLVEAELKRQQQQHGTPHKIDRDFQEGDRVTGYATVTKEGDAEPFHRQDNVLVIVPGRDGDGRGQVLGLLVEGLAGMFKGATIGQTVTIKAVGPEAHERDDIRGVTLAITFEIRNVDRIEPAAAAVVAERYGLASEDVLREQIKLALEHRRNEEQTSAMREQAIDLLANMVEFELPEKLTSQQAGRSLEQFRLDLMYRGVSADDVETRLAEAREESDSATRERLKRFFLLQKLAEHFAVEVSEQEVNGRIAAIAAQNGMRPEKLRGELAQSGRLGEVARMIRDQKAADRVVQQAKQVEVTAEQWNTIFTKKQAERNAKRGAAGGQARKTSRKPADAGDTPRGASKPDAKPDAKPESKPEAKADAKTKTKAKADDGEPAKKKTTRKK